MATKLAAVLAVLFLGTLMPFVDCFPNGAGQPSNFAELGAVLSPSASILLPDDAGFDNATLRWQAYAAPSFRAVVEVATESDIQNTVRLIVTCTVDSVLNSTLISGPIREPALSSIPGHGWRSWLYQYTWTTPKRNRDIHPQDEVNPDQRRRGIRAFGFGIHQRRADQSSLGQKQANR